MGSRCYKYKLDIATIFWTVVHLVGLGGVVFWLFMVGNGASTWIIVWLVTMLVSVLVLMLLSMPRNIVVDKNSLTINCVLDVTKIEFRRIVSIRKVSPSKIRWTFPVFGMNGFWGYYGHFFDVRHLRFVVIYATEWRYLVEIIDEYGRYYYISCRERDDLLGRVD